MASVLDRVRDIAVDKLSVDASDVSADSSFTEDLNADSLEAAVQIIAGSARSMGIEVDL